MQSINIHSLISFVYLSYLLDRQRVHKTQGKKCGTVPVNTVMFRPTCIWRLYIVSLHTSNRSNLSYGVVGIDEIR